jgi:hypothetical protein
VERVYGVDFSGAREAGRSVWVASGVVVRGEDADAPRLRVTDCAPATAAFAAAYDGEPTPERDATLAALRRFLAGREPGSVAALDVSFGLPAALATHLGAETWREGLARVAAFDSAESFAAACREWATSDAAGSDGDGGVYRTRRTDERTGALSPYHFLVKHQTYHAARAVLGPLSRAGRVHVLPMDADAVDGSRPLLVEAYPAATLDALGLHRESYKASGTAARARREANLDGLAAAGVELAPAFPRERTLADEDGDALDAVVAAAAAFRNRPTDATSRQDDRTGPVPPSDAWHPLEGHIYV